MADFGAKYPCFKPATAQEGVCMGKLVAANLTVNLASGELWADDGIAEELSEFSDGSIAMETDNLADNEASVVYGAKAQNGVVTYNRGDTAPEGVLGYYKTLIIRGVRKFRAYIYPRAKAQLGNDNAQTRGSSINFRTAQTSFRIFANENGDWRKTKEFTSEPEARAYVASECSVVGANSLNLSALTIGSLPLVPNFSSSITEYTAVATAASDKITAAAEDAGATVEIKNGNTTVQNAGAATWAAGENTVTVTVKNGGNSKVYTIVVTKSA